MDRSGHRKLLAISATFTAEPIGDTLAFWMDELRLDHEAAFAPYNQVFQQLLDPSSLLAANDGGVNVILARLEDLGRAPGGADFDLDRLEENALHLAACLASAAKSFRSPCLICICPASTKFLADTGRAAVARKIEERLKTAIEELSGVYLVPVAELRNLYPVAQEDDPHGDELGHVPYSPEFFAALGTMLARKTCALRTNPYKVIVLDCDETLWRGICGEDGPEGIVLDAPRRELQEFMRGQREAGMLLCLCSKNNDADVVRTFELHPEMPLRMEDFIARRLNWQAKSTNLAELADELNLALSSFLFVDDNPEECAEVKANCPEALVLRLPRDSSEIPRFLKHVWVFDRLKSTGEDRKRTLLYAQEKQRAQWERRASSLAEFIASLELEIRISPLSPEQLPRVAQLTQRTSQMNLTAIRRTENQVQTALRDGAKECLTVNVRDRFGDYGLTGVAIFETANETLRIDTFLLSCRALGRGVEHRVLAALGELAEQRGLARIDLPFVPTARNIPARQFLESLGVDPSVTPTGQVFQVPASRAKTIVYRPPDSAAKAPANSRSSPSHTPPPGREDIDFARIANELNDAARILDRVRARRALPGSTSPAAQPGTPLERQLASTWAELLGLPSTGLHDDFFDLGGHSLLAVQLLSRVRQTYGVELSLDVVYNNFTVAELAKAIELKEIEQSDPEQYAALLAEIEALSDEEVRILLAREQELEQPGGST